MTLHSSLILTFEKILFKSADISYDGFNLRGFERSSKTGHVAFSLSNNSGVPRRVRLPILARQVGSAGLHSLLSLPASVSAVTISARPSINGCSVIRRYNYRFFYRTGKTSFGSGYQYKNSDCNCKQHDKNFCSLHWFRFYLYCFFQRLNYIAISFF